MMVNHSQKEKCTGYTQQQRQELAKSFNQVLTRCTDQTFGLALSAAAKVIRNEAINN